MAVAPVLKRSGYGPDWSLFIYVYFLQKYHSRVLSITNSEVSQLSATERIRYRVRLPLKLEIVIKQMILTVTHPDSPIFQKESKTTTFDSLYIAN